MTPTYNERDNIFEFLSRAQAAVPNADVYFVDDSSPDGTGNIVAEFAARDSRVNLITRTGKRGYASACREGFVTLVSNGYDAIVTIDCDLSHDPNVIPAMLDRLTLGADVVIGSRYVAGGGVRNWSLLRRLLSRWGNIYTAFMIGATVRDCTSGFRAYRTKIVRSNEIATTSSEGYAFLSETLMKLQARGDVSITEIPIIYTNRVMGDSKMNRTIISESMKLVTKWGFQRLLRRN